MPPRFSVVVPTRERPQTLSACLETCLAQAFEDFEVVVADNASGPETAAVVERAGDPRLRLLRTGEVVPMAANWERAVAAAKGEFVLVLGDDDGLLPHALFEIDKLLRVLGTPLLRWESASYYWPNLPAQDFVTPNTLLLPLSLRDYHHDIHRYDGRERVREVLAGKISYSALPTVYCSAIHRDLFQRLRDGTGRVFHGRCPDVASGFALAFYAGGYPSIDAPMNLAGLSAKSNGVNTFFLARRSPVAQEFRGLNDSAGLVWDRRVPDLPTIEAEVAETFLQVKRWVFPEETGFELDRKRTILQCLREMEPIAESLWPEVRERLRVSLEDDPAALRWFGETFGWKPPAASGGPEYRLRLRRYGERYLHLDAGAFGVEDVAGAARLAEQILGYARDGLNPRLAEPLA